MADEFNLPHRNNVPRIEKRAAAALRDIQGIVSRFAEDTPFSEKTWEANKLASLAAQLKADMEVLEMLCEPGERNELASLAVQLKADVAVLEVLRESGERLDLDGKAATTEEEQ